MFGTAQQQQQQQSAAYINLVWMRECEGCAAVVLSLIYSLFIIFVSCSDAHATIMLRLSIFRTNGKSMDENMQNAKGSPYASFTIRPFFKCAWEPRQRRLIGTACAAIFIIQ